MSAVLEGLAHPVVLAPMAGGPSTPALAAAVSAAGGLGILAGAYRAPDDLRADIAAARELTRAPLGLNLFVPDRRVASPDAVAAYAARMASEGERYGAAPAGLSPDDDDRWDEKLAIAAEGRIQVLSLTFGCPDPAVLEGVRRAGAEVWITVNRADEAEEAAAAGADALVVQGIEAGGHQGGWHEPDDAPGLGLIALLRQVSRRVVLPVVAAGGLTDAEAVAAALAAGADAAQAGTAFLLADEAGTHP
ncbi:MAG: nitronate monooxygenase, partial [Miltoncostaeaceae bacterium]